MSIPSTGPMIRAYRLPAFTVAATPVAPHGITWRPEKNGPGSASFSIPMDDAAYGDIQINDMVAIRPNGNTVATLLVEEIDEHTLDVQGGARQVATYMGRLAGAQLEWALVAPALGDGAKPIEDDAVFDWRSPRYSAAAYGDVWVAANEIMTVTAAKAGAWPHQPMGESFTDSSGAYMILDSAGDDNYAPMHWFLFYRDITVTTPGRYGIELLMDDKGTFWVDGIEQVDVRPEDGFVRSSFKRLELSAGTHRFTWALYNYEDPENPGSGLGPAALAWYLYKTDLQDRPLAGGDSWISDSNTNVMYVNNDPWPGMTVGDDLTLLIGEARDGTVEADRDCFPWLVPNFNRDEDSNGDPWDRVSITTKTQTTNLLQFLDELVAAGRIARWWLRPDGVTLDVFAPGYASRPTFSAPYTAGYELEPAPVNDPRTGQLTQLDRRIT